MMENKRYELMFGDCLERMKEIPDGNVDMVMCDLPYCVTACEWDKIIPFEPLWAAYRRVCKKNAAIVLTASQPFTSALIMSNSDMFKYCWYWVKNRPTGGHHARNRPMAKVEDCAVFSSGSMGHASLLDDEIRMKYYPQGVVATGKVKTVKAKGFHSNLVGPRPNQIGKQYEVETGFPHNVLEFPKEETHLHPTQKPVALMEYLIRTYTNEGETVLDNCMGSGTTGVACAKTGRRFIGIERDETYFTNASERVIDAYAEAKPVETDIL